MFAIAATTGWLKYYSSSPYYNLFKTEHPDFKLFPIDGPPSEETRAEIAKCKALVLCPNVVSLFPEYSNGPKLLLGDDIHCHHQQMLDALLGQFRHVDYYLSPYTLATHTTDWPYKYVPQEIKRARFIFMPNHAPAAEHIPPQPAQKIQKALLAGTVSIVYPFREQVVAAGSGYIERMPFDKDGELLHEKYFEYIARYSMGITCNSWLDYTVAKYFEIPFSKALLIAPYPNNPLELELMGFVDGQNMVRMETASARDVHSHIDEIVGNWDNEFAAVAAEGHKFVLHRHTVTARLNYLSALLHRMQSDGGFKMEEQYDLFKKFGKDDRYKP